MTFSKKTYRNFVVAAIYLFSSLLSFRKNLFNESFGADFCFSIILGLAMVEFCVADSRLKDKPINYNLRFIMFLTWPISVPVYILRSQGIKGIWDIIFYFAFLMLMGSLGLLLRFLLFGQSPFT